ncbi:MAG: cell division FtsA domain-containing protein [Clostridium perfringens]|nr:cell division FtsA domain-containing protein [Clostridium perfringens]
MSDYIVGLDIGSRNICATMSIESQENGFEVLDFICKESFGVKEGKIIDFNLIVNAVKECLRELEKKTERNIKGIYLGFNCINCKIIPSKGYTYVGENSYVNETNVQNAYRDGKNIVLKNNDCIADSIINCFYTTNEECVKNPLGVMSDKLEIDLDLILSNSEYIYSLREVILEAGYEVFGTILSINALKNIFLGQETAGKKVGIIDIGAEKTEIALYNNNQLVGTGEIPFGGEAITKDLSICLEISENTAEQLKKECAKDYIYMAKESIIDLGTREVDARFVHDVIEARLDEILEHIYEEISNNQFYNDIDFFIITGDGIVYFEEIDTKIQGILGKKVTLFKKDDFYLNNSSIITSIGIVKEVYDRLKLICDEKVFSSINTSNNVDTNINTSVDDENKDDNKKNKKRGLSRFKAFLDDIF